MFPNSALLVFRSFFCRWPLRFFFGRRLFGFFGRSHFDRLDFRGYLLRFARALRRFYFRGSRFGSSFLRAFRFSDSGRSLHGLGFGGFRFDGGDRLAAIQSWQNNY